MYMYSSCLVDMLIVLGLFCVCVCVSVCLCVYTCYGEKVIFAHMCVLLVAMLTVRLCQRKCLSSNTRVGDGDF